MLLGVHVSIAGRIYESVSRAEELHCNTFQIFSRNPRSWQSKKIDRSDIEEFKRRSLRYNIGPIAVHIPYLINLASPNKFLYERSIEAYIRDIKSTDNLGAQYFVTHMGSHKGSGLRKGIKNFIDALDRVIDKARPRCMILLENTSGAGNSMGYNFSHIEAIISGLSDSTRLGVCLDTCHAYAAGFDIKTKKGLDDTLKRFDKRIGLDRLKLIHLNDSKGRLGSHLDRHEHIGKGYIGLNGFRNIVNNKILKDMPFILETPKNGPDDDIKNLAIVRGLRDE